MTGLNKRRLPANNGLEMVETTSDRESSRRLLVGGLDSLDGRYRKDAADCVPLLPERARRAGSRQGARPGAARRAGA